MKFVKAARGGTLTVGGEVPALVIALEHEAEPAGFCFNFPEAEVQEFIERLIAERGHEWGDALLRVLDMELEGGDP
jgi:hypothetical protein